MGMIAGLSRVTLEVMEEMKAEKENVENFEEEIVSIDVDKAWAGISYTLVGSLTDEENILYEVIFPKENFVIYEDEYMTEYVNFSSPKRVKQIHQGIKGITKEDFRALFSKRDFKEADVYPGYWDNSNEEHFKYFYRNFKKVQELYQSAANENEYVVVIID